MFWKKIKPFKTFSPDALVFSVINFDLWFNAENNGATYAHPGIYLRTDKLSGNHVKEYLSLCYGIDSSDVDAKVLSDFKERIRYSWLLKMHKGKS